MIKKLLGSAVAFMVMTVSATAAIVDSQEFRDCMAKAGPIGETAISVCYREEVKRDMLKIKDAYEEATKVEELAKWSGSNNMQTGNLRNMFEAWLHYRDLFCAFAGVGNANYMGSEEANNAECTYNLTRQHLIDVSVVLMNSQSSLVTADELQAPTSK